MNEMTLELRFRTDEGQLITFRVPAPKDNLTEEEVSQAMDTLLEQNVFYGNASMIASKVDARIVTRAVETIAV